MENSINIKQSKWWCIHFGHEPMDAKTAKKLQSFFKKITPHFVFGQRKVFLDVSQSKFKKSLYSFQVRVNEIAKILNLSPELWQWGVGSSIAESWVMARWKTLSPELLPIESIYDYLNPLELERNRLNENYRVRLLRGLGASSLQDIIDIPEDVLLSRCGFWVTEFIRGHFSRLQALREGWLESTTSASFFQERITFNLDDWIPDQYFEVA